MSSGNALALERATGFRVLNRKIALVTIGRPSSST